MTQRLRARVWRSVALPVSAAFLAWAKSVEATSRITTAGPGAGFAGPAVYVNWHRYLPFLIGHHGRSRRWLMISPAPYMQPIARWCEAVGLRLVPGAGGEQGRAALAALAQHLAEGDSAFLAVDGPSGPVFQVKRGCVELARKANVPLIPVGYSSKRGFFHPLRWDHWLIPVPFDEVTVTYGAPLDVSGDEPVEEACRRVGDALRAVCDSSAAPG